MGACLTSYFLNQCLTEVSSKVYTQPTQPCKNLPSLNTGPLCVPLTTFYFR